MRYGPDEVIDRVQGDRLAERREGTVVARERGLERDDRAVALHADPRVVHLIAIGRRAQEMLVAGLDPLDRPPEPSRHRRHEDVLGIDVPLHAEAAAHLGNDHADPLLGEPERGGDRAVARQRAPGVEDQTISTPVASSEASTPRGSIGIPATRG